MTYNINDILDVLTESTADSIFNMCDFDIYTEGEKFDKAKETVKKVADAGGKIIDKTVNSKTGKAMGRAYNKVSEGPGELAAKIAYKKPSKDASPEVQKEYNKKVINMKANFKTGMTIATLVVKAPLVGPIDWVITASMVSGLADKDNPVNQETYRKLGAIKDKAVGIKDRIKSLVSKNKDKDSTDKEFNQEYNKLLREGNECAKQADAVLKNVQKSKPQLAAESVIFDKFDNHIITENGTLVDNVFDILYMIVEKTDYDMCDPYPILDRYFEMMY